MDRTNPFISTIITLLLAVMLGACGGSHVVVPVPPGGVPQNPGGGGGGGSNAPLQITAFAASPANIQVGQSSTLTWATTGATSVTISGVTGTLPTSGSVQVSPAESTSYTLVATSASGSTNKSTFVTVSTGAPAAAPTIVTFTANPSTISAGQSTTITWNVQNATEVSISGVGSELAASGSAVVKPQASGDFVLDAIGPGGDVKQSIHVTVNASVVINSFTAVPNQIQAGGQSVLNWNVSGATIVTLNGAAVAATGNQTVSPTATTTYTLVATGADGTVAKQDVIVTVSTIDATGLKKINHIVFMVQENRSFDQYFGKLNDYRVKQGLSPDIDGLTDAMSNPTRDFTGTIKPFHLRTQCMDNTTPSWNDAHPQRNHFHPACTAASCSPALMDGFVYDAGSVALANGYFDTQGARAMGYYTEADMPYYYFMATQFATSNRFFAPVMTRTQPNLMYLFAATSAGFIYPPEPADGTLSNKTIFQLLEEAGISWKFYLPAGTESNVVFTFQPFTNQHADKFVSTDQYFTDLQNGTLPQVAFIASKSGFDEHPGPDDATMKWSPGTATQGVGIHMQWGVQYVSNIINALMQSSSWKDSIFIWSFDEWGGTFDHVPPMQTVPPDDIAPRFKPGDTPGDFSYTGFRVPMMAISPYTKPHYVSNTPMDSTAILKLIEERFDLPALTRRDAAQPSMTEFFDFNNPVYLTPPNPPVQPGNMLCDRTQIP
jgi:phospholipase C